ncbi:MarR family winged helix-turn-helix transcriptional regulator [Microbacterium rhizosphaerae]|uniref:MarR family winged helix-turn-helix transcriptional regulator n=1 Tax=Microbacterium rhizosphaerae TaxID=1678237 RepID=A0ABZ0SKF5_9MICO|nr:MarR family winged helix-turn-helix transcriptional regulator [Microbacterium rhizosphaerae]WPR89305.1 MarR family winged helix-turn-helix transcriptional regulator [Microbacterium rhizosphaerae]
MGSLEETETALSEDISFLLARASALSVAAANAALAPHGLRARSYSVLTIVVEGLNPSQKDLAEFLRLDPSQVVAIVDELEGRGLVERTPDPADRRAKIITPTPDGTELQADAASAVSEAERSTHGLLSPKERRQVAELLRRLAFPGDRSA